MSFNNEQQDKGGEKEEVEKVSLFKLFAFAERWDYLLMTVGSVGAVVHGASVPFFLVFFGKLINAMAVVSPSSPSPTHEVAGYSLDFVYLGAVTLFSSWAEIACWMHTGERQATKMRMAYLRSMLDQDISVFDVEVSAGEVINSITSGILVVQDTIAEKVGNTIYCISRFVIGFGVSFTSVWQISLVTLSIVPLIVITGSIYAYVAALFIGRVRKYHLKAGEIAHETIENMRTVQAFAHEDNSLKRYKSALQMAYQFGKRGGLAKGLGLGMVYCILFLSWTLLIWFTSIMAHKNVSNGGELFTTMLNVVSSGLSLGMAAPNVSMFLRARTAAYPIFKMIERSRTTKIASRTGRTLSSIDGHIEFCNVRFSYPSRPEALIFDELNLNIPAGKIVALVGGSGSGKSTIISLIERFYEPLSGVILLDGHDIKGLDLSWLRRQIGLVNQEPVLFARSIRENILYGKEDASFQEIRDAAKLSEAITFINNLPDQYDTQVGERGIQLSGGQKQRIAIARAMVKNPSILILDEATSALDAESEKCVQEALDRVMVGRTTVMVAHRLSTIRNADIIAVVEGGKIVEIGTHDQLMLDPYSAYVSLLHLQDNPLQQSCHYDTVNFRQPQSVKSSVELSDRSSLGASFHSDKDSVNLGLPGAICESKANPVSIKQLYSMISPDWLFGILGTLGALAVGSQLPLFALGVTQALVSFYFDWETTQREIKKIAITFLAGSMLIVIFQVIEHFNFGIVGERLALRIRERMFQAILHNEIGWFDKMTNNSALLSSRLETDATLLKSIVVDRSTILLQNIGTIITSFIIAFILNWRITLVVLATFPLLVTAHIIEKLFMKGFGVKLNKGYSKANMFAAEAASNIRTIAAFCSEEKVMNLYAQELESHSKKSFRYFHVVGVIFGVSQFLLFSSYGLDLWYGSVLMAKELVSFKSIIKSFFVLMVTAFGVADTLSMAPDIFKGTEMAASIFEVLDRKTQVVRNVGDDVERVEGMIEMSGVVFRYPSRPDVVILNGFDFRVNAGKSMALIGSSGSGKSTVLALILRFYDPAAGKVMIDGKDIKELRLMSLRKHIGLVQQEPALFSTTIYDNILYGKDDATESDIIEAAKLANAHSFISALPEGYSTLVGKGGIQLSGGQKQRIAIARAIIKNPAILLLDEATSALDVESEHTVQQALDCAMRGRTTITVAHRLSTIRNADIISVLQNGKIIEQGNHSTLVENKNGAYFKLICIQQ